MLIPAVNPGAVTVRNVPLLLIPSLSDCLFLAILVWVFAAGSGWSVLLADGDTGWHIRTGEYILDTRAVPVRDLFSFSKAGQPWFAWEWLSDVIFALLYRAWGLKGVVAFTGLVLSFSSAMLYRYMMWRGANLLAALGATYRAVRSRARTLGVRAGHLFRAPRSRSGEGPAGARADRMNGV